MYLRDDPESPLEDIVRKVAAGKYSFQSARLGLEEKTPISGQIIFYQPAVNSTPVYIELYIKGLRTQNPHSAIVLIGKPEMTKDITERIQDKNLRELSPESTSGEISELITRLGTDYLSRPVALVIAESDARPYREELQEIGYQVEHKEGDFRTEELGQYVAHNMQFKIIVVEGKQHIPMIKAVKKSFPSAMVVGVGDASHMREAYVSGCALFLAHDRNTSQALRSFATQYLEAQNVKRVEAAPTQKIGRCYILAGPTCAGKTEAAMQIKDFYSDMVVVQKHTTRKPRADEKDGVDFLFMTKEEMSRQAQGRHYFLTFELKGNRYGIPRQLEDVLRKGNDAVLTVTDLETMGNITCELQKTFQQDVAVPILFYANADTLQNRLHKRSPIEEIKARLQTLETELNEYLSHTNRYKYAINTGVSKSDEMRRIIKGIIEWERDHRGENYADHVLYRVLPPDFLSTILRGEKTTLRIPQEVIEDYAVEYHIPSWKIKHLSEQPVACVSKAYGRIGVFLKPIENIKGANARSVILDLIQRQIKLEPRARRIPWHHLPISVFAKCYDTHTKFNDGLLYMLGDDLVRRETGGDKFYAVTFGLARIPNESYYHYLAMPLDDARINVWNSLARAIIKFPLRPEDNIMP